MVIKDDVTVSNRNGTGTATGIGVEGNNRNRAPARAPASPHHGGTDGYAEPDSGSRSGSSRTVTMGERVAGLGARIRDARPYTAQPASIRDVVEYTRAGGWIPGDHPWWWESPGYAYGVIVAIPLTIMTHMALWVAQRPGRVFTVSVLYGLLLFAGVQLGAWWVDLLWAWGLLSVISLILVIGGKR